ncbi:MAG: peptidylprolyl isomerase [Deltaproteobacteria bacterium]|nr:peptidylprolyl isomerase [Deltaproteobacteria bacterium]
MTLGLQWTAASPAIAEPICMAGSQTDLVRFETVLGDMEVVLCSEDSPITVANFLSYVDDGSYTNDVIVHRSVQGNDCTNGDGICIIQGGGFFIDDQGIMDAVPAMDPIGLEGDGPHEPYSIAMARTDDPISATNQWFINVTKNTFNNEHTVFGEVVVGRNVVDVIAAQETWRLNAGPLSDTPLIDYPDDGSSHVPYFVYVTDIVRLPEPGAGLSIGAGLATLMWLARRRASGLASSG